MTILGLDYGERYIGLAVSDANAVALRHSVIDEKKTSGIEQVVKIIQEEAIDGVVVGVPVALAGTATKQTESTLAFVAKLRAALPTTTPVVTADETFTSIEASRRIEEEGGKPEDEHAEAARLILESYLKRQQ